MAELAWRLAVNLAWIIVLVTFTVLVLVKSRSTLTPTDHPIYPTVELPFNETSVPCEFQGWPTTSMLHFLVIRDSVKKAVEQYVSTQYPIDGDRRLVLEEGEMWYGLRVDADTYALVREKFNELTIPDDLEQLVTTGKTPNPSRLSYVCMQ
jgi:hypothetical protein